ncbi:MAG: DHA2 family efflux MFS transporter permease subunit [Actinomycetota bacterium]|nr:DHA2 family efflux MFS transporter permease subunit [Actinomycetota bacterium]
MTQEAPPAPPVAAAEAQEPWPALFALCLGFFMILVDSTIVSVATPSIIGDLHADVTKVVWVTSAYLLAYAVPVLITGRLGDRYGQKKLYLLGLVVFTLSSLWCGLTGSITMLILARVFQGLGASMMTPQTMAIITRIFPAERRGRAMSLWGATAGVATLVGPILGGVLVDTLGWQWIFFINVPVGLVGFVLAWRLVPKLATHAHRFDWLGVALSGVGMFLLVFGIQEAHQFSWGTISGPISVWSLIIGGLVVFAGFVIWQRRNTREPLIPLSLFKDRNFSLANVGISTMGFAITAMAFPVMLYAQLVRGLSPTGSALLLVPMAVMSIVLAPRVGRLTDQVHPRLLTGFGFLCLVVSLFWLSREMTPDSATWQILLPMALLGVGNACVWAPLSTTANRNLPLQLAGAGAGVYNATRQVGAVLGSAAIALLMDSRLAADGLRLDPSRAAGSSGIPAQAQAPFSHAMAQAMYLPPTVLVLGFVAVIFFARPRHQVSTQLGADARGG